MHYLFEAAVIAQPKRRTRTITDSTVPSTTVHFGSSSGSESAVVPSVAAMFGTWPATATRCALTVSFTAVGDESRKASQVATSFRMARDILECILQEMSATPSLLRHVNTAEGFEVKVLAVP